MCVNKNISMDFPMPAELRSCINGMDKAFDENDIDSWNFYQDVIDHFVKNCYNRGQITSEQMQAIYERYGTVS